MAADQQLRIGFVPEHFSTPLYFAQRHYGLECSTVPFPSGTGAMVTALRDGSIDVGIGLTEGWINGLAAAQQKNQPRGYRIVGTYVDSPLCWAISTGPRRGDIINKSLSELCNPKVGVSRIGSGSFVMASVLADQHGWSDPDKSTSQKFEAISLENFEGLRKGVNDGTADFFMWEYFTSKRYYDHGEIIQIGQIYTPWSSWKIVAADSVGDSDPRLQAVFSKLDQGIEHFQGHQDEAVAYISTELDYSNEDATEWLKTVKFPPRTRGVKRSTLEHTVKDLQKAKCFKEANIEAMASFIRE